MNYWGRALALVAGALFFVSSFVAPSSAQTIRPVIAEYPQQALGHFDLVNSGIVPLSVSLEAKAFTVSETGAISFQPLPAQIHLKLSATSFRIAPRQAYTVYYSAKADALPAWFVVYAFMTPVPPRGATGMQVQVELPHTVYLLSKDKVKKQEVVVESATFDPVAHKISVSVANHALNLTRVLDLEVTGKKGHAESNGFPLFPNGRRVVELPWQNEDEPSKVTVRLSGFSVEGPVSSLAP